MSDPGSSPAFSWPASTSIAAVLIVSIALIVYRQTVSFGLFADDFQWIDAAQHFTVGDLTVLGTHFFRPGMPLYFLGAWGVCGFSASCYHVLSIVAHVLVALLVGAMVATVSRRALAGILAGVLFAGQPAPVEAVVWVSAISEVLTTAFIVLSVWLFARALRVGSVRLFTMSFVASIAAMLCHESGVLVFPLVVLVVLQRRTEPIGARRMIAASLPFAIAFLLYGTVSFMVNTRNYVVTEGHYGFGTHIITNVLGALVSFTVAYRSTAIALAVAVCFGALVALRKGPIRFYTAWLILCLMPFAGFRDGLTSRYLYLSAVGFAAVVAEVGVWIWDLLASRRVAGIACALLWVVLVVRSETFAVKDARSLQHEREPYDQYAELVRARYPVVTAVGPVAVPPPPPRIPDRYVEPFLRWEYHSPNLAVTITR